MVDGGSKSPRVFVDKSGRLWSVLVCLYQLSTLVCLGGGVFVRNILLIFFEPTHQVLDEGRAVRGVGESEQRGQSALLLQGRLVLTQHLVDLAVRRRDRDRQGRAHDARGQPAGDGQNCATRNICQPKRIHKSPKLDNLHINN